MSAPVATLRQRRCDNHPQREASARCPECAKFFCRECITEHDDRVLCASCLAKLSVKKTKDKARWEWAPRVGLALCAIVLIFFMMLLIGNLLIDVPSHFHDKGGW
jgi:uncharacterized paraquat-inducible protein A